MDASSIAANDETRVNQFERPIYRVPDRYDGSRFWSENGSYSESLYNDELTMALRAIDEASVLNNKNPFVICDYGAGDGGTSFKFMIEIKGALRRKHGFEKPLLIIYEDQPWNDFNSLFRVTQGESINLDSSPVAFQNVHIFASGSSFFGSCTPPNYVDLAVSSNAMHWLSKRPCTLERAIFCQEEADVSDKERHAYQKQAAEDWETILINRAREMKTGAHLIIGLMGLKDANEFRRPNSGGTPAYLRVLRDIWWSNVEQGVITKEEFKNTNAAYYRRSEVELKAPFVSKDSKVLKEGLKLISIKMKDVPINPAAMVGKEKVTGTRSIKRYVNSVQAWSNAIFYSGLSEHRSEEERKVIMDQLYSQFEECIMCNPDDFIFEFTMAYVDIVKT